MKCKLLFHSNLLYKSLFAWLFLCLATIAFAQPANNLCTSATTLTVHSNSCTAPSTGTNVDATPSGELPNPTCSSFGIGQDVWYKFTVPATGNVSIEMNTAGGPTDWAMSVYSGVCGALVQVECDDDDGPGLFPRIDLTGRTPGEVLHVRVWEYGSNAFGAFTICAWEPAPPPPPPANNLCAGATNLTVHPNTCAAQTLGTNVSATASGQLPAPSCGNFGVGQDVWYKFTVPASGQVTIEMSAAPGGPTDWAMSAYSGACGGLTHIDVETILGHHRHHILLELSHRMHHYMQT